MLIVDTTYFGKRKSKGFFGIMVFRSYELKKNLLRKEVKRENKKDYIDGIYELQQQGRTIKAVVSDGKKGVLGSVLGIPSQMCHFHQKQIVQRYITQNPILEANIELKEIAESICKFSKRSLKLLLDDRYRRYKTFLGERNEHGNLIHNRTKQAYNSIVRNLKYLYTYKDYKGIIDIPPTTNSLESIFSQLKTYLGVHRGLTKERKLKFIFSYLQK